LVALQQSASQPCVNQSTESGAVIHFNHTACDAAKAATSDAVDAAEAAVASAQGQLDLLKRGGAPAQQAQVEAAVQQAQAQVDATRSRLDALKSGGVAAARAQAQAQKQQSQGALVQAEEGLKVAQANVAAAKNGNLDVQVKNAQAQVTAAVERLKSDKAKLDVTDRGPRDEDIRQAKAAVDQAEQQLLKARTPYTALDLRQQEHGVAQAKAQLDKAISPYTAQDMDSAQAAVDAAQAQLDMAELVLRETIVLAPVDGVISERLVAQGALVNAQTPLVTLVPPSLELVVNVEEKQLGQVAVGQLVQLAVAAYPGETFSGSVRSVAPTLDTRNRTAAVHIEPTEAGDKLRAGMFVRLDIVTGQKQGALLVPRQAIVNTGSGDPLVLTVDDNGRVHKQPVRVGLQNAQLVEVVSGVDDGRLVVTSNLNDIREGDIVAAQVQNLTAQIR
jgi:RND family efflux transporter MFP subunit